jgi:hypothetical protein
MMAPQTVMPIRIEAGNPGTMTSQHLHLVLKNGPTDAISTIISYNLTREPAQIIQVGEMLWPPLAQRLKIHNPGCLSLFRIPTFYHPHLGSIRAEGETENQAVFPQHFLCLLYVSLAFGSIQDSVGQPL